MNTIQDSPEIQNSSGVEEQKYQKIGGWLFLVGIGVAVTPLLLLYSISTNLAPVFFDDTWTILTTPGTEAYHPMWAPLIMFELLGNIAFFTFSLAVAICFFQKRKILPKLIIAFMLSNLAFVVIDHFMANSIPFIANMGDNESITGIVRSTIYCLIWVPYFLISKRVKGTFVH